MNKKELLFGLLIALVLAFLFSPLASSWPDGLEKVAEGLGFLERGGPAAPAPAPDYLVPGIRSEALSTALAGLTGTLLVFGASLGLAALLRRKRAR
ncbi:MAG: cobalt transport protein CbiN [candidate division TA06 bacterium ADurb.Bin417]|uniref:Cobalt transport protein CbiN n=1 Tax=candidate division TA06 bacterium ADurb.Bin417 TaxID=1852828 RepID=A0A1V5M9N3_UNCT6|nr:MAG: cobalt transport protein CbiN [candidate division TA06 bacterium ADurb.Bin417]